ncbi:MAG: YggT family protein [Acidobacteria bacterium]|nr:YggT family protein [Acidobacteriota bacterium]
MTPDEDTNKVLLDEERRQASHQEVKATIDGDVNARIQQESARTKPEESAAVAEVASKLKQQAVQEAIDMERETGRGRVAARLSQFVDYLFYLIYGLIGLEFLLRLMGARTGNGFVQFIGGVTRPLLAPFERIVPTASNGANQIVFSYLLALIVYVLLHLAVNGLFRLVAHRKVTV